jgi:TPR repeat protein
MYVTGHGVQQDDSAAALWFRKAAEQGYAFARSNLGALYCDGRGVTQDYTEAVMWFRKAADQGDAVAEFQLGDLYANGKGVPQDYSEAMIWFQRAAEQGHPVAPTCNRTTPRGQLPLETPWHRRPHRQLTKILLVMVRLSLI